MTDKPLLFSAPMVKAILAGDKTQTRRIVKPRNAHFGSATRLFWQHSDMSLAHRDGRGSESEYLHVPCHRGDEKELLRLDDHWRNKGGNSYRAAFPNVGPCAVCDENHWRMTSHRLRSRYEPGGRLWVRETWQEYRENSAAQQEAIQRSIERIRTGESQDIAREVLSWEFGGGPPAVLYAADFGDWAYHVNSDLRPWRPSIFMPRWASRITLEIVGVRVERVQDISRDDARAEGIPEYGREAFKLGLIDDKRPFHEYDNRTTIENYRILWDSINGNWDENPWVWAISFKQVNA